MKRTIPWRLLCFFIIFTAALWYPVRKIREYEFPAVPPEEFRFRVTGVDPNDLFRGRYIVLHIPVPELTTTDLNAAGYRFIVLERDPEGFAKPTVLLRQIDPERSCLRIRYSGVRRDWKGNRPLNTGRHIFHFPFTRFYLNEEIAPVAERLLNKAKRAELAVLVYPNGNYAVRELYLDGVPVREAVRRARN